MMRDLLNRYHAVVEIIFALAMLIGLLYSIKQRDAVAVGTIVGGILGYMKGRSDAKADLVSGDNH